MKLTGEDIKQITDSSLDRLAAEQLLSFTKRLLTYSKELMDRLNQNSNNSSRPPSSAAPWESQNNSNQLKNVDDSGDSAVDDDHQNDDKDDIADKEEETVSKKNSHTEVNNTTSSDEKLSCANTGSQLTLPPPENKRSAGKQIGAPGFGRTRELLHDWDIIFRQLHDPLLPLTNNEAERMLRHWVIDRRLSYGTRTLEGTRQFSLLASVIETCHIRRAPIWNYLASVIAAARVGSQLPALQIMQA